MASWKYVYAATAGTTIVALAAAPLAVPAAVAALGFGSGGIVADTWAAGFMSTYAGVVPAGSLCAVLQSIGAAGLSGPTIAAMEGGAAAAAAGFGVAWKKWVGRDSPPAADAPKDDHDDDPPPAGSESDAPEGSESGDHATQVADASKDDHNNNPPPLAAAWGTELS